MILWYGDFIGDFKSPTCPDVPGGKEKKIASTIGLCRHVVAFDVIWRDLTVFCFPSLWSALCAWEKKFVLESLTRHVPRNMLMKKKTWNSTPQWARTAENQPRVKITADHIVHLPPILNTFLWDVGQKWLSIPILSNIWGGVRPRLAVILITAHFMKFQLWDCSSLENLVWTGLWVIFRTVWTWGTLNLVIWVFKNLKSDHFWRFYALKTMLEQCGYLRSKCQNLSYSNFWPEMELWDWFHL